MLADYIGPRFPYLEKELLQEYQSLVQNYLQFYYQIILIGGNTKNTIIEAIRTNPPNPRRTAPEIISASTNKLIKQITDFDCSYYLP